MQKKSRVSVVSTNILITTEIRHDGLISVEIEIYAIVELRGMSPNDAGQEGIINLVQ